MFWCGSAGASGTTAGGASPGWAHSGLGRTLQHRVSYHLRGGVPFLDLVTGRIHIASVPTPMSGRGDARASLCAHSFVLYLAAPVLGPAARSSLTLLLALVQVSGYGRPGARGATGRLRWRSTGSCAVVHGCACLGRHDRSKAAVGVCILFYVVHVESSVLFHFAQRAAGLWLLSTAHLFFWSVLCCSRAPACNSVTMVSTQLLALTACQALAVAAIAYRWPDIQQWFGAQPRCGSPAEYVIVSRQVVTPDGIFPAAGTCSMVPPCAACADFSQLPPQRRPAAVQVKRGLIRRIAPINISAQDARANLTRYAHLLTGLKTVLDFGNLTVMPGVLDTHVHQNEPGRADWEGAGAIPAAAAPGQLAAPLQWRRSRRPRQAAGCCRLPERQPGCCRGRRDDLRGHAAQQRPGYHDRRAAGRQAARLKGAHPATLRAGRAGLS